MLWFAQNKSSAARRLAAPALSAFALLTSPTGLLAGRPLRLARSPVARSRSPADRALSRPIRASMEVPQSTRRPARGTRPPTTSPSIPLTAAAPAVWPTLTAPSFSVRGRASTATGPRPLRRNPVAQSLSRADRSSIRHSAAAVTRWSPTAGEPDHRDWSFGEHEWRRR